MIDHSDEAARISALRQYQIATILPDEAIDRVTRLASLFCETPVSLVVDGNHRWYSANTGMPGFETPRLVEFCQYVVANGASLEVPDTTLDVRFQYHALVTTAPAIRFYAGFPLINPEGVVLGTLCVMDQKPRQLSPLQHNALQDLSQTVMDLIDLIDLIAQRRLPPQWQSVDQLTTLDNDLMVVASRNGYFRTVNPAFERLLGWTTDELRQAEWYSWIHPEDRDGTRQLVEALRKDSVELTNRFRGSDGTYRLLHWVISPKPGTDTWFALIGEVTPQIQREKAHRQDRQLLAQTTLEPGRVAERPGKLQQLLALQRAIFTHGGLAIIVTDPTGLIQRVNPAVENWTGYRQDELVGQSRHRLLDPMDQQPMAAQLGTALGEASLTDFEWMRHYLQGHRVLQGKTALLSKAGQQRPVLATITGLYAADQTLLGYVDLAVDISSLKEVESALRASEERFQEIADYVGEIFWVRDVQSQRFIYVNPAYETMSGLSRADLYTDPRDFLRFVVAEDHPRLLAALQDPQPDTQLQFRVHHRNGQVHWLQARMVEVLDESGTLIRRIGVARDITAARENEQLLEELLQKERRLTDHQAHFITTASHMFRTPLTAMSTSIQLAQLYLDRLPDSGVRACIDKHLKTITRNIDALEGLLRDTLSLESVQPDKLLISMTAVDLVGLSESLIEVHAASAARQAHRVDLHVIGRPVPVAGDERLLTLVVCHLLRNAYTYSDGSPRLQLSYGVSAVVVAVSDEGIGIPLEEQPYIFDRFYRARNAGDFQGLGLGLAICQEQLRVLGSELWVESTEGVGTTLSFQLGYAENQAGST
ncbi:PAS domain S-box protein [Spirosoma sp.]|uniref:PAS domain S-box protein n=1 Tax=Spirosoma sp. TaxID=1899569 RepID=UPI0026136C56|nr:PAS domain S-box protein [Spirosoma sp.]MCX6212859.1 PAS domain S-box protein [Spirosoma sp.]